MYLCKILNRKRLAVSQDTLEMKDYKEILSKFDKDYYKNLVQEKVERYNEVGQVCRVSLRWRGKYYHLQLFFPGAKFPTRKEVEAQVHKVYPDAVVMVHYSSESQPNQPLIRVAEGNLIHGDYGTYIDGQKLPKNKEKKLVDVPYESLAHNANKEEFQLSGNQLNEDADPGTDLATLKAKKFNAKAKAESEKDVKDSIRGKVDMNKYYKFSLGDYKAEENKYYKGNPKGIPNTPNAGDRRPVVTGEKNCGCGQNPCITYGKKKHNCASKVKHEEYGVGKCISRMHDLDENGNVAHYDVMFEHGIEKNVSVSSLEILVTEMHEHVIHEGKNKENFSPHKMIDPSTKKEYMADTYEKHKKYEKMGYVHETFNEDKSFVEFMKRIEHLPDVTKEAIKNCGDDPLVAKAALEISGLPK